MQEQSVMNRMESELMLTVEMVIKKINKFSGEHVTQYLKVYEYVMASRGAPRVHMVSLINRVCTLNVQVRVMELQERFNEQWTGFQGAFSSGMRKG